LRKYKTLFVTQRGQRHQDAARQAAPAELDILMVRTTAKSELVSLLRDAEFLITERAGIIDAEAIEAASALKLIQRLGSLSFDIDVDHARAKGIPVCVMPVTSCILVAEHVILQMLGLLRSVRELFRITDEAGHWGTPQRCDENTFAYNWAKRSGIRSIRGSTVGILGFGEIGAELARRLRPFDCKVVYSKRSRLPQTVEDELNIEHTSVESLAARSDIVVSLLPNLPENNQSIGAAFFSKMKPGALLIHDGAPGVVNEDDMIAALNASHLAGAAVDCFTYEPLRPDDPLLKLARDPARNLLLTPHVAAGTVSANSSERMHDYDNVLAVIRGQPLCHQL
jgi:phosphoglycerate dehydrogenase-like enzyme